MASALYPKWKEQLIQAGANTALTGDIRVILIDTADYTYSAVHDFLDDVAAISRVGTATALATKTYTDGVFDAADTVMTSVTGDPSEALILFHEGGATDATRRLVAYIDGFTVTPNGGNITLQWDSGVNRIFKL